MNLDVNTLFLVTIYVEAILGLLLLFAWAQNTAITAVAWWGFAHLLRAASVTLFGLYGSVSDLISIDLANAILFTSFAVTWTGARLFDHRKPQFVLLFARRRAVARRLPDSGLHRFPRPSRAVVVRHYHRVYLGRRVRILARPQRASGFALAGDLHAVRARRALFAAHAARRLAAVACEKQSAAGKRVALGAQLRGTVVHHCDRLHSSGDGEGARRASPEDRGDDRSLDRHLQSPRVPGGRRGEPQAPGQRSAPDRGDAARSR